MLKNTANQKWVVYAFYATTGLGKTGDAAQITANIRKDYGDPAAVADTNPTELEDGFYAFDMAQAETNADHLLLCPQSSTSNIVVVGCPAVIFTEPTGRKYPASLAAADVSGNVPAEVKAQDNIDFGALQKASITAAVPTAAQNADAVLEESLADHKEVTNSLAKTLFETNQRLNGTNVVVDADNGTIKVYDTNGTDLLFTLTKTATGNVYTITRS